MKENEKYLLHCAGIYELLAWLEKQEKIGQKALIKDQFIYLSDLGSSFFALGISNHKKYKNPFLALQTSVQKWAKNIMWDHITVRKNDNYLYLVSSVIEGDHITYSDIPSFAIAISFDVQEKLNFLNNFKKIDGRELYIEDKEAHVNFHKRIFNLPIKKVEPNEAILSESNIINNNLLLRKVNIELQDTFMYEPEFKGNAEMQTDEKKLFEKLFGKKKSSN